VTPPLPRSQFAVTERYVYLNHAAAGVLPRSCVAAIEAFVRAQAEAGTFGTNPYLERLDEYREKVARFIGARGDEIALVRNVSDGVNAVASGIDWHPGERVLLCDNEFPANTVPWLALRRLGVEVQIVPTRNQRLTPDVLRRELRPGTRAVAVSWVSYADGYRHDLAALGEIARKAGALFCVDAIQGLGAFPIDVESCGVVVLFCAASKWLLGLQGSGFFYVRSGLIDRLILAAPGWRSMHDEWNFGGFDQPYAASARRFEGGTPSFLGAAVMATAIDVLARGDGAAAIAPHVLSLTDRLCEGLTRLGAEIATPRGEGISSGIVTFSMPGCDSVGLGRELEQREGIVTTFRRSGIRVSPHGYNTGEEIDRLLAALPQYARTGAAKA
jgi:cysteine desulfurase/selenocysteine lyase